MISLSKVIKKEKIYNKIEKNTLAIEKKNNL